MVLRSDFASFHGDDEVLGATLRAIEEAVVLCSQMMTDFVATVLGSYLSSIKSQCQCSVPMRLYCYIVLLLHR